MKSLKSFTYIGEEVKKRKEKSVYFVCVCVCVCVRVLYSSFGPHRKLPLCMFVLRISDSAGNVGFDQMLPSRNVKSEGKRCI